MNATDALTKLDNVLRGKHYSRSTRRTYLFWVRRYCEALKKNPQVRNAVDSRSRVETFLSGLARQEYSASSQNQAFNAVLFFYRNVLKQELGNIDALRAKKPKHIRTAAEPEDTRRFLAAIQDDSGYPMRLLAHMYYEMGLRLSEATRIRLKDISLRRQQVMIRNGKGGKDRIVSLPCSLYVPVQQQMRLASAMWEQDRQNDLPVPLPGRLSRKHPSSQFAQSWYWLFPAHRPCEHPRGSGRMYRWHIHESTVSKALTKAAKATGLSGRISAHVLRHSYATDLLNQGGNVRVIQASMGHKHLDTTMGYIHVTDDARLWSPLERVSVPTSETAVPA